MILTPYAEVIVAKSIELKDPLFPKITYTYDEAPIAKSSTPSPLTSPNPVIYFPNYYPADLPSIVEEVRV